MTTTTGLKDELVARLQGLLSRCNNRWQFGQQGFNDAAFQAMTHAVLQQLCSCWYHVRPEHELDGGKRRVDFALIPRTAARRSLKLPTVLIELKYIKARCCVLDQRSNVGRWRSWSNARNGNWFASPAFAALVLEDLAQWRSIYKVPVLLNRKRTTVGKHIAATEHGQLAQYLRLAQGEAPAREEEVVGFVLLGLGNRVLAGTVQQ